VEHESAAKSGQRDKPPTESEMSAGPGAVVAAAAAERSEEAEWDANGKAAPKAAGETDDELIAQIATRSGVYLLTCAWAAAVRARLFGATAMAPHREASRLCGTWPN
jgi:hypothetical protein